MNYDELKLRFEAIVEAAVDGIITIDEQGYLNFINKAACNLFGYQPEEVIGQKINILMPPHYATQHDGYMHRYIQTGKKHIIGIGREVIGLRKDGVIFPFWLSVSEFKLADRYIFTGVVHDISSLKQAQDEVTKLNIKLLDNNIALEKKVAERTETLDQVVKEVTKINQQLAQEITERKNAEKALQIKGEELSAALSLEKELNEMKTRFVSMASHEFRTPLSTVLSSASLVRRYGEMGNFEKQQHHLDKIKLAVNHLTGILNDFLSISKIDEGKTEQLPEVFEFCSTIAEFIDEVQVIRKPEQEIRLSIPNARANVFMDKRHLKAIVYNLVSNAIKYSDKDVFCTCTHSHNWVSIDIRDQGRGIPKAEQAHMFERFFRASNVSAIQGTGLGLNIVKSYVDQMGGIIEFVSREGQGTTFTVKLPMRNEKDTNY